ncbi:unnamed protein product [Protopolystoma xenopodis]|uniref:Uncharacterized protein n=1 Tax=Protopolystoma xenopodis TaxID=117903 RepID=A0A3S5CB95_9PLAT|nr:unnamed protein product [Protopolystoma xenopodis]
MLVAVGRKSNRYVVCSRLSCRPITTRLHVLEWLDYVIRAHSHDFSAYVHPKTGNANAVRNSNVPQMTYLP